MARGLLDNPAQANDQEATAVSWKIRLVPLLVAAATLVVPVPVHAGTGTAADPRGDVTGAGDPRSDITAVDISYAAGSVTLGMTVAQPEKPSSRNWVEGDTGILWTIFHPSGGEYEANFSAFDDGPAGSLFDPADTELCKGQVSAQYTPDGRYTVTFPASCLGDPASLSITSELGYDDIAAGKGPSEDVAPDGYEECCSVTP